MKIGVDASRYSHEQATGVEWYSWHIINALFEEAKDDEFVFYSRESRKVAGREAKVLKAKRFWTLRALSREMKADAPDVLFVPSHTLPLSLPKRSVITIHDVAFKHLREAYSFVQYKYLDWSTKFAVKNATKIIVPSEATSEDLQKLYKCPASKIAVVPHGFVAPSPVDDSVFDTSEILRYFGLDANSKYFLFVGRLETKKNLRRLVEAFKEFCDAHDDVRLVLAGKRGIGFKEILKTVDDLEMMHKVVMPGYINEEEKAVLYKHCLAFVFPSMYEGFGLPILEAFHYEKPVMCSKISSLPEVGGDAVYYVNPKSVEDMAVGLESILLNPELVVKGRERLKQYSWQKAARETLKVLHG